MEQLKDGYNCLLIFELFFSHNIKVQEEIIMLTLVLTDVMKIVYNFFEIFMVKTKV